ncbi:TIGR01777 family oxidoreductase [Gynuella sunshinyii]|uniref:Putative nucleoside-diphosphate sugar epimerase n=1 Tax=Gynuella sunshinyii YC6258 TaxID=1445510 RepID=A0A0C5V678_9GAMM|nr:TIGR01777 family oxidoreductase [Gynuella sunshinyii]AJQ94970.1 putative nucleoside-diphosphate sugar epimerase [Gynuella sunshinyii YC6258]
MKVLITGGTGFIGSTLTKKWAKDGHHVTILTRQQLTNRETIRYVSTLDDINSEEIFDVVVNLAGYSLFQRPWTKSVKQEITDSRIVTTKALVALNQRLQHPFGILISGSAVGIYGNQHNHWLPEDSHHGQHFGAQLCEQWEQEALQAEHQGTRVCLIRTGIVLGPGGALQRMQAAARWGVISPIGSGLQYWPWIDIDDEVNAIDFLAQHPQLSGAFNLCSPNPVTNSEFTNALASTMNRKVRLPAVPAWILKTLTLGAGQLLIDSQRAVPSQLLGAGFKFQYENLTDSLLRFSR